MITSLGEERAGLCVVLHTLMFVIFSLPLGVGGWLRHSLDLSINLLNVHITAKKS